MPLSAAIRLLIAVFDTMSLLSITRSDVPFAFGRPDTLRAPAPPLTSIVTLSFVPLPIVTLPFIVALPDTASVPPTTVLPVATPTLNAAPPTVRFCPVTSRPFVASTLPLNVT